MELRFCLEGKENRYSTSLVSRFLINWSLERLGTSMCLHRLIGFKVPRYFKVVPKCFAN